MIGILISILEIIIKALNREGILTNFEVSKCNDLIKKIYSKSDNISEIEKEAEKSIEVLQRKSNLCYKAAELVNLKRELTNKESRILSWVKREIQRTTN